MRSTPLGALAQLWLVGSCGSGAWLPPGKLAVYQLDLTAWLLECATIRSEFVE